MGEQITGCTAGYFCKITDSMVNAITTSGDCIKKGGIDSAFECVNDLVGNRDNNSCKNGFCNKNTKRCTAYLKRGDTCTETDENSPDFECDGGLRCKNKKGKKCRPKN